MLKLVFLCALGCGSSLSATAGERGEPVGLKRLASTDATTHVVRRAATARASVSAQPNNVSHPVTTFVMPENTKALHYDIEAAKPGAKVLADSSVRPVVVTSFAMNDPHGLATWHVSGTLPQVTASSGARYAVGDALADHRRVGPPRSPLDAMLVLKIDGSNDSPPLSLGGGIAGAVWKAGLNR